VVHKDRNSRRSPDLRRLRQHPGSWAPIIAYAARALRFPFPATGLG
jgi:hypothetical protein